LFLGREPCRKKAHLFCRIGRYTATIPSRGNNRLKSSSLSHLAAAAIFAAILFPLFAIAQALQTQPSPSPVSGPPHREFHFPQPKNLQVLPKNLTGDQVHHIMEGWSKALGTHCTTCHSADPDASVEAGRQPQLDFALDKKPEKKTARLMATMVEEINGNFIGKIDNAGIKVSCGTCHRGHLSPPIFFPPPELHEEPAPGGTTAAVPATAP
jgi:hypothetical protein